MKTPRSYLLAMLLPLAACAEGSTAPKAVAAPLAADDPRVALAAKIPGAKPEDLQATPVPGIFELKHGVDISYVSADAKYVFAGDMYRIAAKGDFPNLSEGRRRELRLQMLGDVPESQMLVFGAADAAHTITVFTDVDCPWCRKLHSQIADYNKLGIRVRYMFFPRTGPDTESWYKADTVWCSADRKQAFTHAKLGEKVAIKACPESPVAREYKLGHELGVTGTPGVVLENGELVPGYLPPAQMLAHIRESLEEDKVIRAQKP